MVTPANNALIVARSGVTFQASPVTVRHIRVFA